MLLSDENDQYFSEEFPVFFKQSNGLSAMDVALGNNQIRSVNLMVNYMIKYQNSHTYFHLFQHTIVDMLQKGVTMAPLMNSNICNWQFDFDEWPATHHNTSLMMRGYNDSVFELRYKYPNVFNKLATAKARPNKKVFKVKYELNLITDVFEDDGQIIEALADCEELEVFLQPVVQNFINFKWQFAFNVQAVLTLIHVIKQVALIIYINIAYISQLEVENNDYKGNLWW